MGKGNTTVEQQQQVSQQTSVNVTNVIENPGLEPLQKLSLITDIFAKMDEINLKKQTAGTPDTILSINQIPNAAFYSQPSFIILITAAAALLIFLKGNK